MAAPRCILPGQICFITRRCQGRQYLLRPGSQLNQIFQYCLAHWANHYGIGLVAIVVQSNHYHLVLWDPRGVLPDFVRDLDRTLAECVNALRKRNGKPRRGPVFESHRSYGLQTLETEQALIEKCAYTLANPVRAGLVRRSHQWPGVVSCPSDLCRGPKWIERPNLYFADTHKWPQRVPLQLRPPPGFDTHTEHFAQAVEAQLRDIEHEEKTKLDAAGRSVLGEKRILRTSPFDAPRTEDEPTPIHPRFVAATAEGIRRAKRRLRDWHHAYRQAFTAFQAGDHTTLFPAGAWWMPIYTCARCAPS